MWNMLRGEWYKIRKSKVTKVIGIVILLYTALNSAAETYINASHFDGNYTGIDCFQSFFAGETHLMLLAIFVSILISNEYATGSIRQIVSHGFSKKKIVLAKYFIGCFTFYAMYMIAALINMGVVSITGGIGEVNAEIIGRLILLVFGELAIAMGYGALVSFVAWLFKSGGITVAINIIILLAGEIGVSILYMVTKKEFFVKYWISSMSRGIADITTAFSDTCIFIGIFAVMAIVFVAASTILFNKRDVD